MNNKLHDRLLQRKKLGQVFLRSRGTISKIVDDVGFQPEDAVLEIGGGDGRVSAMIAPLVNKLFVVEFDKRFFDTLYDRFDGVENVFPIHGDILAPEIFAAVLDNVTGGKLVIYGSIPYNITTPILRWLLDIAAHVSRAAFLVQKEVARRVVAAPGSKTYGFTSVIMQLSAELKLGQVVGRREFQPVPKVDSQLLHIRPFTQGSRIPGPDFIKMISIMFNQRRKQIGNSLRSYLHGKLDEKTKAELDHNGFSLKSRPEEYSPERLLELYRIVSERQDRG